MVLVGIKANRTIHDVALCMCKTKEHMLINTVLQLVDLDCTRNSI
jgi:hypothetical protein